MDLQGRVIVATEIRRGTSKRTGLEWVAQDFVIETHENYPRKVVFSVFGEDRLKRFNIQIGQEIIVSFDIDAHEYRGRWFNSLRAYDVRLVDPASVGSAVPTGFDAKQQLAQASPEGVSSASQASSFQGGSTPPASDFNSSTDTDDDLPF